MKPVALDVDPVFYALNMPELYFGVERKLFRQAALFGAFVFAAFHTIVWALVIFGILYLAAREITSIDPRLLPMMAKSFRVATRFDPAKYRYREVEILDANDTLSAHARPVPSHA